MSTTHKVEAGSLMAVATLVLILGAAGLGRHSGAGRANDAWSQRLTQQAQQLQEQALAERAADAWSRRLTGLAQLEGKAPEQRATGMSDRAIATWSVRLNGLAGYYAAQK